jgi:hypothetical protein
MVGANATHVATRSASGSNNVLIIQPVRPDR